MYEAKEHRKIYIRYEKINFGIKPIYFYITVR